jgi:hypothetical protein
MSTERNGQAFDYQKQVLAWGIATIVFCNHYCRDTPGALERELETEAGLSNTQYNSMQTAFFLPDIITPLLSTFLIARVGGASNMLVLTSCIGSFGVLLFSIGVATDTVGTIMTGRFLSGCVYEVIDMLPILILGPVFQDDWGQMVGSVNAFLRLGSALNFIISPITYREFGLSGAAFTSFAVSLGMIGFGFLARATYIRLIALNQSQVKSQSPEGVTGRQKGCYESSIAPLSEFGSVWYFYMLAGTALYGAMVPFWFIGSKYLQLRFAFDVQRADALMLLPEGSIILLGPLLGIFLDRMKFTKRTKLLQLAVGVALLPIGYLVLVGGPESGEVVTSHPVSGGSSASPSSTTTDHFNFRTGNNTEITPSYLEDYHHERNDPHYASPLYAYAGMVLIGSAYAASNSLFWTLITSVCSEKHLTLQTGIIASMMNVLPTFVPPLIVGINALFRDKDAGRGAYEAMIAPSTRGIVILAILGAVGAVFAVLASISVPEVDEDEGEDEDDLEGNLGEGEGGGKDEDDGVRRPGSQRSGWNTDTVYQPLSNESHHSEAEAGAELEMT